MTELTCRTTDYVTKTLDFGDQKKAIAMTHEMPAQEKRQDRRGSPVIYVLAAGMLSCLLYLVTMSLWALTTDITSAGDRELMVSFDSTSFAEAKADPPPREPGPEK